MPYGLECGKVVPIKRRAATKGADHDSTHTGQAESPEVSTTKTTSTSGKPTRSKKKASPMSNTRDPGRARRPAGHPRKHAPDGPGGKGRRHSPFMAVADQIAEENESPEE